MQPPNKHFKTPDPGLKLFPVHFAQQVDNIVDSHPPADAWPPALSRPRLSRSRTAQRKRWRRRE